MKTKPRLSWKTIRSLGEALEASSALHVLQAQTTPGALRYLNSGHRTTEEALARLRRALRLPDSFSFTANKKL